MNEPITLDELKEVQEAGPTAALDILMETIARLEAALYAPGWEQLTSSTLEQEFSKDGLNRIVDLATLMYLKNPVILRGVELGRLFVFGKGVKITAADEEIDAVIQDFLKDQRNRVIFNHQGLGALEVGQKLKANTFFRFFINETSGRVRLRTIPFKEIVDIVTNPEDRDEVLFYERHIMMSTADGKEEYRKVYYPDWRFNPAPADREKIAAKYLGRDADVDWDTPVYQVATKKVGRWGVSEVYPALDWARAYKTFLGKLAAVWEALATWAWSLTKKGPQKGLEAARKKLEQGTAAGSVTSPVPPLTASTFIGNENTTMQPFRTAGATMSAKDGRELLLSAIMLFGFPETYYGDVSVGTLATAASLELPVELVVVDRQSLWSSVLIDILEFVVTAAVHAPRGALRSIGRPTVERDGAVDRVLGVAWAEDVDPTIIVQFPPVKESDVPGRVASIVAANMAGEGVPLETTVLELLKVLGVPDIDKVMAEWREINETMPAEPAENTTEAYQSAMLALSDALSAISTLRQQYDTAVEGHQNGSQV